MSQFTQPTNRLKTGKSIVYFYEVYFYEAISKYDVQYTRKTNLLVTYLFIGKIGFHQIASPVQSVQCQDFPPCNNMKTESM